MYYEKVRGVEVTGFEEICVEEQRSLVGGSTMKKKSTLVI